MAISASGRVCPCEIGRAPHDHRVAEVGLVLDPVEVDAQRRGQPRIEDAVLDERHQRPGDQGRPVSLCGDRWFPLGFLLCEM